MKKGIKKRTVAFIMAVLMIVGSMPIDFMAITTKASTASEEKSTLTWSAADILAAGTTDKGLTIRGDGWANNTATDAISFADGLAVAGDNAKAGTIKPQTAGANAVGTVPDAGCFLEYKPVSDGTLSIYAKIGKDKTFYVVGNDGSVISKKNETASSIYHILEVEVKAGVTYSAYLSAATAQIWKVVYEASAKSWNAAEILAATTADNGLTLCGDGWVNNLAADALQFADGFAVAGDNAKAGSVKARTAGASAVGTIPDEGCFVKYEAPAKGTLSVYAKIGGGKTFYIIGSDGSVVNKKNETTASTYNIVEAEVKEGVTYYAYLASATAQIWKVAYSPVSNATLIAWDQVVAPTIDLITQDTDGNLVVDFTSVIDDLAGAEDVRVTMYSGGFEVDTAVVTSQKSQVIFTPGWSGNYTFKAVAQRTGEADKASSEKAYDNYVLSVPKPVVELIQNKGAGKVYLDWINIEDANSYDVEYRVAGSVDYTKAATAITAANYTFEGLTVGTEYDFRITATRNSDSYKSTYEKKGFTVTSVADQQWYFSTVGSAQETNAVIKDGTTTEQTVALSSKDTATTKTNIIEGSAVANTTKTLTINGSDNGKISDGEEGFQYYYTMINPNIENFELTATFRISDTSLTPDNQTGFGIIATDMLGVNYYGKPDYVHKYFNSVSNQFYSAKGKFMGLRVITGYESVDTTSFDGITRTTTESRYKNTAGDFVAENTYTFTLKKTNDAYIAICNGEEYSYSDLSCLTVQEDGSICVGIFAARKVSVEISNMTFTTSVSTGVGSGAAEKLVTPSVQVLSSGTSGTSEYEYIYYPNVAGKLTITAPDKSTAFDKNVAAYEVVKVKMPVSIGDNVITSTLVPDNSQKLTSYATINKTTTVSCQKIGIEGETICVSPDGSATGKGTMESPLDIYTAVKYAQPGQIIYLLNGSYQGNDVVIGRSVSGTADKPITMVAQETDKVIFEGIGLNVIGSYWHIYGIYVHYPNSVGIQICGNYNTIEMCTVEGSKNTGIQISRSGGAENKAGLESLLWPSYNLVKNCESFDNCDAGHNDADGFAAKLTCGEGNVFYGCIGHNNIDDGWDLFAKTISGEIGTVIIENCVAYSNGWLTTDDTSVAGYVYGEGNGFKLGGSYMKGGHILKNSVAFNNQGKGITSNSCPDNEIYNCTSYNNALKSTTQFNIGLNTKASNVKEWIVKGLISMADIKNTTTEDLIPFSLASEDNYIFDGSISHNNKGVQAVASWFVNTDVTVDPERNEDGTINMHGLLVLNETAPANSGGRLDITSSTAKSVKPSITTIVNSTTITDPIGNDVVKIVAGSEETVTSDQVLTAVSNLNQNQELLLDTTNGSVSEINNDVFKMAAIKNAKIVIQGNGYKWEFSDIPENTEDSLKSAVVTIDAKVAELTAKLNSDTSVDSSKVLQISFAHSGTLPGEAKVTLSVKDKFLAGTTLHFYYYNPTTGLFESLQTCIVDSDGNVQVALTHCSEYILTENELPQSLTTAAIDNSGVTVATGDKAPIKILVAVIIIAAIAGVSSFVFTIKRKKRKDNM